MSLCYMLLSELAIMYGREGARYTHNSNLSLQRDILTWQTCRQNVPVSLSVTVFLFVSTLIVTTTLPVCHLLPSLRSSLGAPGLSPNSNNNNTSKPYSTDYIALVSARTQTCQQTHLFLQLTSTGTGIDELPPHVDH